MLRTADIRAAVQAAAVPLGEIVPVSRDSLSWRLTVPADGRLPHGSVAPHVIQWDDGARPWEGMADMGCTLEELRLTYPYSDWLNDVSKSFCIEEGREIMIKHGPRAGLSALISTPSGRVEL